MGNPMNVQLLKLTLSILAAWIALFSHGSVASNESQADQKSSTKPIDPSVKPSISLTEGRPVKDGRSAKQADQKGSNQVQGIENDVPKSNVSTTQQGGRAINDLIVTPAKSSGPKSVQANPGMATAGAGPGSIAGSSRIAPESDALEDRVRQLLSEKLGRDGDLVLRVSPETPLTKTPASASKQQVSSLPLSSASPASVGSAGAQSGSAVIGSSKPVSRLWDWTGQRGPDFWGRIDPSYSSCSNGRLQSPPVIAEGNIQQSQISLPRLNWIPQRFSWSRQGPVWTVNFPQGAASEFRAESFSLVGMQFRFPGEPFMGSKAPVGSIHFIHVSGGRTMVIALTIRSVKSVMNRHPAITELLKRFPLDDSDKVESGDSTIDVASFFPSPPKSGVFFVGSLSHPPCSEGVLWVLINEVLELPEDQVDELAGLVGTGVRSNQSAGQRAFLLLNPAQDR
ncbi:MAG: hypothetical protein EBS73_10945 [Betaproteobacteria bacterium]|nr:hypothetical protein [Betaproteobacteria bacterium]